MPATSEAMGVVTDRHPPDVREGDNTAAEGERTTDPLDSGRLDWIWDGGLEERGYTADDLVTTARVLSRTCPTCTAGIGAWCRTAAGHVLAHLDLQHVTRRSFG